MLSIELGMKLSATIEIYFGQGKRKDMEYRNDDEIFYVFSKFDNLRDLYSKVSIYDIVLMKQFVDDRKKVDIVPIREFISQTNRVIIKNFFIIKYNDMRLCMNHIILEEYTVTAAY